MPSRDDLTDVEFKIAPNIYSRTVSLEGLAGSLGSLSAASFGDLINQIGKEHTVYLGENVLNSVTPVLHTATEVNLLLQQQMQQSALLSQQATFLAAQQTERNRTLYNTMVGNAPDPATPKKPSLLFDDTPPRGRPRGY
jgi:hypothetical protein